MATDTLEDRVGLDHDPQSQSHPHPTSRSRPRVVIVGGGLAGLAAASQLVEGDFEVLLLESRPRLGGRASSFYDPAINQLVDNGQHVAMGCCTNLHHLCHQVGIERPFHRLNAIRFLGPEGQLVHLKASSWPAPFHLGTSFAGMTYLSWKERWQVARAVGRLASPSILNQSTLLSDWLLAQGQSIRAINLFWAPLIVSALNEQVDRVDVCYARKVIIDGFLRHRDGYCVDIPVDPLGEQFGRKLGDWITTRGGRIELNASVRHLWLDGQRLCGVQLRDGRMIEADLVVVAVPFHRVESLFPAGVADAIPQVSRLKQIPTSPISGIHLWFDRPGFPYDHLVTPGRFLHWIFDRTGWNHSPSSDPPDQMGLYLQSIISASGDLSHLSQQQMIDLAIGELEEIAPALRQARRIHARVVTEKTATFSAQPGTEDLRPDNATTIEGLYLAGDYTKTDWPATMESAVRSGFRVAESIRARRGEKVQLVQAGLPANWLTRLWLGPREAALT